MYLPAYYGQLGAPVAPPQAGSMRIVSVSLACNSGGTIHCYVQLALDRCLGGHPRRRQQVAEILDNKWTQNAGKRCGGGGSEGARKIESIIKKLRLAGAVWASCRLLCETAARKSLGGNLRERKTSWNEKFESRQTTTGQRSPSYCSIRNASHADTHRHRQAHTDTDRHTHTHTHTHTRHHHHYTCRLLCHINGFFHSISPLLLLPLGKVTSGILCTRADRFPKPQRPLHSIQEFPMAEKNPK